MRTFTVEGRGEFPMDMLRRDRCDAADEASRTALEATYDNGGDIGRRCVTLATDERLITEDRWRSFGWPVVEGGDGPPRPVYQVVFQVHESRAHGSPVATIPVAVDNLDPDGQIVGELGRAVSAATAREPRLNGQGPYLYAALHGLFAITRARMETEFRRNGRVDDISSRTVWTPDFAIEIRIS